MVPLFRDGHRETSPTTLTTWFSHRFRTPPSARQGLIFGPLRGGMCLDSVLEAIQESKRVVDLRGLKAQLRKKLPPDSPVLLDLLGEPDSLPVARAEVLIPHYLQRLERELEKRESGRPLTLRS